MRRSFAISLVLVVSLLAPIIAAAEALTLQPTWRHGGLDDDEAFFGVINGVAAGPDGHVYLSDAQLMTVHVVAPDGALLSSLGRQGEGPGEVTRLGGVLPLADGTIGLVQLMPGQVVKVSPEGLPAGTVLPRWPEAGGRVMLQELRSAGGQLVAAGRRMTRGEQGPIVDQWIASLDATGELSHFFFRDQVARSFASGTIKEADLDWPGAGRWATTADGKVILAPERNAYRLQVLGPAGVEREFGRPFESRRRTAQEVALVESRFQRMSGGGGRGGGGRPANLAVEVLPHEADILAIHTRPDGQVWVQTSRSHLDQPAGVMLAYDVFDAGGNFTGQIAVACEGVAPRDALFPLQDGSFVLVIGHADALAAMRGAETADTSAADLALEVVGLRPAP
jgi:hypothetical protein